jgi:hypothetical protein
MPILLNRIPCLDKGWVATYDTSCNSEKLNELAVEFYKRLDGGFLKENSSLAVIMKCPLFIQLNLSQFNLRVTNLPNIGSDELESYYPNVGEISGTDLRTSQDIADDMVRTSAALLMNHKAYQADGCNRFLSQILTPINTYTTILVNGMYNDWSRFISQSGAPAPIAAYMVAVDQLLKAEWR